MYSIHYTSNERYYKIVVAMVTGAFGSLDIGAGLVAEVGPPRFGARIEPRNWRAAFAVAAAVRERVRAAERALDRLRSAPEQRVLLRVARNQRAQVLQRVATLAVGCNQPIKSHIKIQQYLLIILLTIND